MRVLLLSGEFPPQQGGVGDYTKELAIALAKCGVDSHVLSSEQGAADYSNDEQSIKVLRLIKKWNWASIAVASRVIRELDPDIVHIQYQTAAFGMHPAINALPRFLSSRILTNLIELTASFARGKKNASRRRPQSVTTFHDLKVPYLFPKAGLLRSKVTFELAYSSGAVIATNQEDWERLGKQVGGKLSLIPIGSNISPQPPKDFDRQAWRKQLGVSPDDLLLSYFGFLNESKGGEELVQALAELPKARLLMIGGQVGASDPTNVSYLARVKRLIAELGLGERVLWTGYTSAAQVSANLLASDICVLPYRDGASFRRGSFMAAVAHGLPIVTTSSGTENTTGGQALPLLKDGTNVVMVRPKDPDAVAQAIKRLADEPDLREKIGRGALELATCFTWDRIAYEHLKLYNRLTGQVSNAARDGQPEVSSP